jgi:hypothetical protein
MAKTDGHKWEFKPRFRRHAFGWKSQPAIQRVKQAVSEIKKVAKHDPVLGAEGAVILLERLSPALDHVDSSSGAIGTAVNNAIAGWLARAEQKDDEAVALMRSAADLEDSTDKHPVTPGSILPAHEQLADLLAELGQPAQALAEYKTSLVSAPARLNSYAGVARAAKAAGQEQKAKFFHARSVALCSGRLPDRATPAKAATRD